MEEYTKQELRDAGATERPDKNNTNQRSQNQSPMLGYQDAYLQQQLLQQLQPPVAGVSVIPEAMVAAIMTAVIARGQIPLGVAQPPQQQQLYGFPQHPHLVPVPISGDGGIPTSTGSIIPDGYRGPQQQQQPQPHVAQQPLMYQGQPFSSHMDPHQSNSGSSSRVSPNPGADRGGGESHYELLHSPKRPPQQQQQWQHEPWRRQLQEQKQQHRVRQGQYDSPFTPQGRFEPLIVIPDLNAPGKFPRLPRVLGEMSVRHEEWSAFMQVYI